MASPQPDRFIRVSTEYLRALCLANIPARPRQMLDAIICKTWGYRKKWDAISASQFETMTNMSWSQQQKARIWLINANMIQVRNRNRGTIEYTIQKDYDLWTTCGKLAEEGQTDRAKNGRSTVPKTANRPCQKSLHTIDNLQKIKKRDKSAKENRKAVDDLVDGILEKKATT